MKRSIVNCEYCYNKTIIEHEDDEIVTTCQLCGEKKDEELAELDFNE